MKTAIVLYELSQLASLDTLITKRSEEGEAPIIVSLDAEIDFALEKRGIPFISGRTLQNRTTPATLLRADEIVHTLYDHEGLSFLKYRKVSFLDPLRFSTMIYIVYLFHYIIYQRQYVLGSSISVVYYKVCMKLRHLGPAKLKPL